MISLSYSRISLADIAQKLQLDSPEDAEFIVAKVTCIVEIRARVAAVSQHWWCHVSRPSATA